MINIKIDDDGKIREYNIPDDKLKYKYLKLFIGKTPILVRQPNGRYLQRIKGCNYCGACCIVDKNYKLGVKEMEGEIVCKHLEKIKIAKLSDDAPVDPETSPESSLGSHLKERNDAEVYICTNPLSPFGCSAGPMCTNGKECCPDECTIKYSELMEI